MIICLNSSNFSAESTKEENGKIMLLRKKFIAKMLDSSQDLETNRNVRETACSTLDISKFIFHGMII